MLEGGLQSRAAYIISLPKAIDEAQSFLGYVLSTELSSHSILFSITCTNVTGRIMKRRQL